jgi:hypothetical protein
MSVPEANEVGRQWAKKALADWENGVKKKHPTRAEAKRIAEEESFRKFISEDINPYWKTFGNFDFEAQEGLIEISWQLQRSELRAVKKSTGTMFGPRRATDAKELERRRAVAQSARTQYELVKSAQLVMDTINWRVTDRFLEETEFRFSGMKLDHVRIQNEREAKKKTLRKCIRHLAEVVEPYSPEKAMLVPDFSRVANHI